MIAARLDDALTPLPIQLSNRADWCLRVDPMSGAPAVAFTADRWPIPHREPRGLKQLRTSPRFVGRR